MYKGRRVVWLSISGICPVIVFPEADKRLGCGCGGGGGGGGVGVSGGVDSCWPARPFQPRGSTPPLPRPSPVRGGVRGG